MKKRVRNHITDTAGTKLLEAALPDEWVIRPYQPDYGIDFEVEVFDRQGEDAICLGEHFFIQLKSHQRTEWMARRVFGRHNVEKSALTIDREESREIKVLAESLDTSDVQLARSMGPAVPLLLVVADLAEKRLNWLCLNDFADKVLVPEAGDLASQASHTAHVPHWNTVSRADGDLIPLRFFARRGKLYAAFNRFRYQRHEMQRAYDGYQALEQRPGAETELLRLADHFLSIVLAYDFWLTTHAWPALRITHARTVPIHERVRRVLAGESIEKVVADVGPGVDALDPRACAQFSLVSDAMMAFDQLATLANMFEEICREWYLPTYLGDLAEETAIR